MAQMYSLDEMPVHLTGLRGTGSVPQIHVLDDSDDPLIAEYLRAHGPVHYVITNGDVRRFVRRRKALKGSLLVTLAMFPVMLGLLLVNSAGRQDGLLHSVLEHWGLGSFVLPNWMAVLPSIVALIMLLSVSVFLYSVLTIDSISPQSLARRRVLAQVRRDAQRWQHARLHGESAERRDVGPWWAAPLLVSWLFGAVAGAAAAALWRDELALQAVWALGPRALELVTLVGCWVVLPAGLIICALAALSSLSARARLMVCSVVGGLTLLIAAGLIMVGTGDVETVVPALITT